MLTRQQRADLKDSWAFLVNRCDWERKRKSQSYLQRNERKIKFPSKYWVDIFHFSFLRHLGTRRQEDEICIHHASQSCRSSSSHLPSNLTIMVSFHGGFLATIREAMGARGPCLMGFRRLEGLWTLSHMGEWESRPAYEGYIEIGNSESDNGGIGLGIWKSKTYIQAPFRVSWGKSLSSNTKISLNINTKS